MTEQYPMDRWDQHGVVWPQYPAPCLSKTKQHFSRNGSYPLSSAVVEACFAVLLLEQSPSHYLINTESGPSKLVRSKFNRGKGVTPSKLIQVKTSKLTDDKNMVIKYGSLHIIVTLPSKALFVNDLMINHHFGLLCLTKTFRRKIMLVWMICLCLLILIIIFTKAQVEAVELLQFIILDYHST